MCASYVLCCSLYLDTCFGSLQSAFQLKADHSSELLHLSLGDLMAGVGRQARVVDTQNRGVCFEVLGKTLGCVRLTLYAQVKRLEAAQ